MSERRGIRLHESPTLQVDDVRCFAPAGGPGDEEHADATQVVLPLEGVFEVVYDGSDAVTADASSVVVFGAGIDHRVGHPAAGGDRSMVLHFPPEIVEEALDPQRRHGGPVGSRVNLGARTLGSGLSRATIDGLEAEDLALALLTLIGADLGDHDRSYRPPGAHQRDRVERVRALLATAPEHRWRLEELARAVHCSPFHLTRQFRAITGTSISVHLLRLRLALALQRLAEGEADLARLAADLGFSSQSHFGARFRSVFGTSPGSVRDALSAGRLSELRTMVTAEDRAAS